MWYLNDTRDGEWPLLDLRREYYDLPEINIRCARHASKKKHEIDAMENWCQEIYKSS